VTDGDEQGESSDGDNGEQEEEHEGANLPSDVEDSVDKPGDGTSESPDPMTLEEAEAQGMLILVNKTHPLDKNYKPDDLEKIKYYAPDRSEAGRYLRAEAADAFHQMVEKASEEGIELKMTTAYRSYDFQKLLYDNYVKKEGEAAANRYSAKPGQSEHQTGLAADVSSPSVNYQLTQEYGETDEGKWLAAHAHEFGFIIRYPKDKEDITGYLYEPWHVRYVGISTAEEIYEKDLTLEEYLNILR
jgi:D-alanyl-D-alanine carboxypeptidase